MEDLPSSQLRNSQISFVSAVFAVPLKIFSSLLTKLNLEKRTGAEGFEPSNTGSKDLCLTTWPRPNRGSKTTYSSTIFWKYSCRGNGFASFTRKRFSKAEPARTASETS